MDIMSIMKKYIKDKDPKVKLHMECVLIRLHHSFIIKINYTSLEEKRYNTQEILYKSSCEDLK